MIKVAAQEKPNSKITKSIVQLSSPINNKPLKRTISAATKKNKLPIPPRRAEKNRANEMPVTLPKTQSTLVTKPVGNQDTKHSPKRDWNSIAKEVIHNTADKELLRDQRQGELWLKSPSIMYGKPRDFFDKQDKRAMLADTDESKRKSIFPKKKKKSGIGIKLGKSCFLGLKEIDYNDPSDRNYSGSAIPMSCDF